MPEHEELVPVTVYLPVELADYYRRRAEAEDRSISAECRRILTRAATQEGAA